MEVKHSYCQANHGQSEEGLKTQEKEEYNGPSSDSQLSNLSKTKEHSNKVRERYGVPALQGDLWQS